VLCINGELGVYCCFVHRCLPIDVNMLFSNQKIFLDVKDYSRIDQLEADIRQFGGTIEKFLSKDVTCVITNRGKVDNMSQRKDVSAIPCAPRQSLQPSCGSKIMSRGQSLLMRSNSLKDTSVCDPVTFAQIWGIKTVSLDTVLKAIERQLPTCAPSSPASKQSDKSHDIKKRRKLSGTSVKDEDKSRPFVTKFSGPFIKFEDTQSNFRPFFHQYATFPHLDFEGDLSNGIFRCAKNLQPAVMRKNVSTVVANTRKQKVWSKRGYCECCDTMYDDLNQHLTGVEHQRFAEHVENFADLDKLINQIHLSDSSVMLLPSEDKCSHHVVDEIEGLLTHCAQEVNNNSQFTAAAVSPSSHNVNLTPNQSPEQQGKPEEPNEVISAAKNSEGTGNQSTTCVSINGVYAHAVSLENQRADIGISDKLHSQRLPVHCDSGTIFSRSNTVSKVDDCCKTDEALHRVKFHNILTVDNLSHGDDSSQLISSNYVLNLLHVLSSENSVDSALHAEEAQCSAVDVCEDANRLNPVAECITSACSYNAARAELIADEKERCQQTSLSAVVDQSCFSLVFPQNDLLGQFDVRTVTEHHSNDTDKCAAKSQQVTDLPDLPALTTDGAVIPAETSLSANISGNNNDTQCCNMIVDDGAPVLPLRELNDNNSCISLAALSVDQPAMCAATVKTEPATSDYADCQANGDCTFGGGASSPVPSSDSVAESFDLHDKLLTMACEPDIAQHDNSLQASNPCSADTVDFSTSSNNNSCLPFVFGLPLCLSEDSAPVADCSDAGLCTPVHCCSDPLETSTTSNTLIESKSMCQRSSFSVIRSFIESAQVNDGSESSVPYVGWQTNIDMINSVSDKQVDEYLVQEQGDLQIKQIKCDESAEYTSLHEDCCRSTALAPTQLGTTLVDDGLDLYHSNPFNNIPGSLLPKFSELSLHPESNKSPVVEPPESCNVVEPVAEADANAGNDTDSTLIYSCDHLTSSVLEHASDGNSPDKNESETTVGRGQPAACSPSSVWKVISCVDCRMRLIRTEAVCQTPSTQNNHIGDNIPSVLELESQDATLPVEGADVISDTTSTTVCSCECPTSGIADHTEPTVSSANSTWKVISFADCRMRLVRTQAVLPTSFASAVSSDSRHWYAKNSCNACAGVQFLLSKTTDNILSY